MINIRHYLFETNSSAIHSMVILPANEYKKWKNDGLYLKDDKLYTEEEVIKNISQLRYEEYGFYSYSAWNPEYNLAEEENEYTTPGGEEIIIRCKYGQDY